MAVRTVAAPPTPLSKQLKKPQIDKSAYVHSFSNIVGDVKIGAKVMIAPGTSIRADEGTPFYIGEQTNIQDGVVIHGLEKGRVVGDDGQEYSVWIGKQACITHMALIHGPAYVGDNCFVGFRSTVFNARVGHGCIIMMHALIQDVEIPAGKYVPSGAVITNQQQADRLPNIAESDRNFARHVVEINDALRAGYQYTSDTAGIRPFQPQKQSINDVKETSYNNPVTIMSVNTNIRAQIRSLLSQGYKIGLEYADKRRFKTSSWLSGGFITTMREDQAVAELENQLKDLRGEYVRLIGVDPQAKRRVLEMIIQRPEDIPGEPSRTSTTVHTSSRTHHGGNGHLDTDITHQIRSMVSQGYKIGTEFADQRRYRTSSWLTGPAIETKNENVALKDIEGILAEHGGEYVRLIGIDPKVKKRMAEIIIQRPGEKASFSKNGTNTTTYGGNNPSPKTSASLRGVSSDMISQVRSLLSQGFKIGTEHADKRRFKTGSWQSCTPIESNRESDVVAALETCMAQHQGEYVRLLGIDSKAKRRVLEAIIQRPDDSSSNGSKSTTKTSNTSSYSNYSGTTSTATVRTSLSSEVVNQIRSLLSQGLKIGMEHADKRRFKTGSWQSCTPIESKRESDVVAALEACMSEHRGEYVRLLGIDANAKRRVVETIIQRPDDTSSNSSKSTAKTSNASSYSSYSGTTSTATVRTSLSSEVVNQIRSLLSQGLKIGMEHADKRRFKTGSWQSCTPIESKRESDVVAALEACMSEHRGEYVRLLGIDANAKRRVVETIVQRP